MFEVKAYPPVKPDKIADLVDAVNAAIQSVKNVYSAVAEYERNANRFKGKSAYSRFNINRWDNIETMTKLLHAEAWRYLLERFEPFMSASERNNWENEIEKGRTPEFTESAAIETMRSFIERTPDNIIERIKECFESIKPKWKTEYKTNQKNQFKIGKKHIVTFAVGSWGNYLTVHGEKFFHSLDLAFSLLDGKGVPKYPNDLVTILKTALHENKDKLETEYFKFKIYQNGNAHIEFKRMDLVSELNRIGSGGKLELNKGVENVD